MSASDADQVQDPVLVATDPVISHEVPVPVDGQILKDVSNIGSYETPESVVVGLVKADASNDAVGPAASADEKENAPSHEQPASGEDGVFADDKERIIHGSDIALEKTKDVQDTPVVEVDTAASDSITTDNVDDTTLNEKDNDIIAVKDIPSILEVENVATVEHGIPADSDLIAPVAKITEANTIDDSVNDSAIEIPLPVLEKKEGCAKDDEDDAAPANDVKLAETGNHSEAVQMDERDATDNVDSTPDIMNEAPNGETLVIAEVALQEQENVVNVDADIASSAAEGDVLDIGAMPKTKEEITSIAAQVDAEVEPAASMQGNLSSDHVESAVASSEAVVETQADVPIATVEQTQGEDASAVAEEQVPVVEPAPTEADLKEDGAAVATETEIAVESNDPTEGVVDETSAEPNAGPLVEKVEVGHEVEPAADDVNNIEEVSSHEEPVHPVVEEGPEVPVRVVEEIPDTGEDAAVAVDETTEAPKTVEEPTNDAEASISSLVEVESISIEAPDGEVTFEEGRPASEVEPVVANETIAAPVDAGVGVETEAPLEELSAPVEGELVPASDTVDEAASVAVEEEVDPASAVVTEPVIESEEGVPTAEDVKIATPETTNGEASAKVEVEPVTADEEVIAVPVDEPVTTEAVAEVGNEEASVQVETGPIATSVDEPIAPVESEEVEPLPVNKVVTASVIEGEEVAQNSDEIGAVAPETSVETCEEAPVTIEVQHVENIAEEAEEETTALVLAEPVTETEAVAEKASEVEAAGDDDVTQEVPGSDEPESILTSDEVAVTIVEVTEEPVPAPIEETSVTTVNVENEVIPVSVDALDQVETKNTPVEVAAAASGEAEPVDSELLASGEELTTTISEAAAPQADDEIIHEASAPAPDADNDTVGEAQATHAGTPGEIALDTESSTAIAEGEAVAVAPAPIEAEAGTSQNAESVLQTDASVEEIPSVKALEPEEQEETTVIEIQHPRSLPENAESSADVSELAGKEAIDLSSEVPVEESTSTPVVDSVAVKENVPELKTGVISIETSLDTTPFTPILDSGIGFKEQEAVPSTLSSIAEEFERSKSSWGPSSFQVFNVGGVESSGVSDVGTAPESTEPAKTASVPLLIVEDTPVNKQVASEDFVSVDKPSLEQSPGPWTPSYSVHSQGSPTKVGLAEDFPSIDAPVPSELQESAIAAHELPLEEQNGLASIPVEDGLTAEVISHNESSGQIIEDAVGSHVLEADQVSEPAPADLTEVSEEVTGGLEAAVGQEDANENAVQEANHKVEAKLAVDDTPARPWTPSYSTHSQGTPLVATKELEDDLPASVTSDVALSAERSVENHAENAVTVDSEHDNTVNEQIDTSVPIDAQDTTHSEPLTAEFDKSEIPSSVEPSQNNSIGEVVAAAIAPAIALAALGVGIQGSVTVTDKEAPRVTVDTSAVPLLSVPSEDVGADATDTIVDAPERPRSPWTPSYSVTKQGAGLSQEEEAEVDHLEPLSPAAAAQAALTSDSEPLLNEVQEDDSASSALQTRPLYTVAGTEEIAKNEQFLLFGLRAIVAYLWVLPKWLSTTSSDHSRQGSSSSSSSSSSKFFPGGWFTPKPNEGHTSLDVAQGEFASSPKVTTSNDVFETLGSEITDSSAAVYVAAEDDGRKRKWCVVM